MKSLTKFLIYFFTLLLVLIFFVFSTYGSIPSIYSIKDLEILSEEKNYYEFFDHALDIRPIERNGHWLNMVYKSAENFLKETIETKQFTPATLKYVEKLSLWPALRNNEIFQIKRAEYGIGYIDHCYKNPLKSAHQESSCYQSAATFWKNTPKDNINLKLGLNLSELIKSHAPREDIDFFYQDIMLNQFAGSVCDNLVLVDNFLNKLNNDSYLLKKELRPHQVMEKYISESCFEFMIFHLKNKLSMSTNASEKFLYLDLLNSKNYLDSKESDYYLTSFILDGPENGALFNLAWNTIQELGHDHKRRELVINQFKQAPFLPGELFKMQNKERVEVIFDHIQKNIPEYLNYYTSTCIKYLKGEIAALNGNPTPACHDLFRRSPIKNWPTSELKQTYQQSL